MTQKNSTPSKGGPVTKNPTRKEVDDVFSKFAGLIQASNRPIPNRYGDGRDHDATEEQQTGVWNDMKVLKKGGYLGETLKTLWMHMSHARKGGPVDDKTMIMERMIQLSARLPPTSKLRVSLTTKQVGQLWNSLQHPPLSYCGDKFTYRQADGSYNNIQEPHLGAAGSPYARTVKPMTKMPGAPPDAETLFDSIFSRGKNGEHYRESDNNISSMLFYTASIIIHDLFRTNRQDWNISDTSSYLDLSPLYGHNQEMQNTVRTFKDGKLKPDCFAEKRLLAFPPGVSVFLIMFNRFHNHVAENLKLINENNRFGIKFDHAWIGEDEATWRPKAIKKQDEDLFQTARLVTCGLYINYILNDYLRVIVNLNRVDTTWTLDPRFEASKVYNPDGTPAGIGNMVSVEFNLVYRWHSCISKRDDAWTQEFYKGLFPDKDPDQLTLMEFVMGVKKWEATIPEDPAERTIENFQRTKTGHFNDDDLVGLLKESIEDPAGCFGARNVPHVLKLVEVMGIEQTRKWKVASLNEFREFFGLKKHATFEDINPDPEIANTLRQLYDSPEYVELYPGLVAEADKKPMVPGVGIGPTYTISRAILSDAVTLVRSDRFYTVDYTAGALTNWGIEEASSNPDILHGCVAYKLFLKAFPNHFKYNSIYALYPMTIPSENKKIYDALGTSHEFSWDPPRREPGRITVQSYAAVTHILKNPQDFSIQWKPGFDFIMEAPFMLSGDGPPYSNIREHVQGCFYTEGVDWKRQIREFYEDLTTQMIRNKAYRIHGTGCYQVDAVRDIGNMAQTHFAATIFNLPLKTATNPKGIYTEQELYMILCAMFTAIFFDMDVSKSYPLRRAAYAATRQLGSIVELQVKALKSRSWLLKLWDPMNVLSRNQSALADYGHHMIRRLLETGESPSDVTWKYIIPTAGASAPNQGQIFAQVLDFYLQPENAVHLAEIQRLAQETGVDNFELIKKYALEGARLAGTFGLYRRVERDSLHLSDGSYGDLNLRKGDMVFVSFISASRDPDTFPDPMEIKLDRPEDSYIQYGVGPHTCLGKAANIVSLTTMLMMFGRLKGLRRAPGGQGVMKTLPKPGGFKVYMREDWSAVWPFPTSLKVRFDDII
ncbi:heme peroxidase [Ascodesmis nigricans]|uniref:Heme peroxidase n=1 Tax=Ascodesmis nigricans TaxID=341454 RepID=A0A4S2MQI2_9PEZI|nr:heme peroxidase [Ascodesmis nigricans]